MILKKVPGAAVVKLDDGRILSVSDLPAANAHTHWVASRKQTVVLAVVHGLISRDEALKRYKLSEEEFDGWCCAIATHGKVALKATLLQQYRQRPSNQDQEEPRQYP